MGTVTRKLTWGLFPLLLASLGTSVLPGQVPQRDAFQGRLPKPGAPLPDLTIYDSQGNPFPLQNLRGTYTVLVFGCLT